MRLLLLIGFAVIARLATAESEVQYFKDFKSPNDEYAIRLFVGSSLGNTWYNRAQLIEVRSQRVLHTFTEEEKDGGGYGPDSIIWSPLSSSVAVSRHDHRTGDVQVLRKVAAEFRKSGIPHITLPHERDIYNDGRPAQTWLEAVRWISESDLLLEASGLIQQQRGVKANLSYEYKIRIRFDGKQSGSVKSIKRTKFQRDDAWRRTRAA